MRRGLLALALVCAAPAAAQHIEAVDRAWSGHDAPFALVVIDSHIFVGYYDAARQLSIASRPRGSFWWTYAKLPSWDAHNRIAMAVDATAAYGWRITPPAGSR